MAQLGYHPGGPFLDAWAPALCQQMRAPESSAAGGSNRHNDAAAAAGMVDGEADHKQQDLWQNLSLAFVVCPCACLSSLSLLT